MARIISSVGRHQEEMGVIRNAQTMGIPTRAVPKGYTTTMISDLVVNRREVDARPWYHRSLERFKVLRVF